MGFNSITRLAAQILIKKKSQEHLSSRLFSKNTQMKGFQRYFSKIKKSMCTTYILLQPFLSQVDLLPPRIRIQPMSTVEYSPTVKLLKVIPNPCHLFSVNSPLCIPHWLPARIPIQPPWLLLLLWSPTGHQGPKLEQMTQPPYFTHSNFQLSSQRPPLSWDPYPSLLPPLQSGK